MSEPVAVSGQSASCAAPILPVTPLAIAAGLALLLGAGLRLLDADVPLWLDEVLTASVAVQDSFGKLVQEILYEANAPLYYAVIYYWSHWFGVSNVAMRMPAYIFGVTAPLIALIPTRSIGGQTRYMWSISLALWLPALWYSQESRCYTLLMCMTTACTIAYVRLLDGPSIRRAALWVLFGSLSILSHYHASTLIACQGLAYLWIHRAQALRTWPAALLFIPTVAWLAIHIPGVLHFGGENAWQSKLTVDDLPAIGNFLFGGVLFACLLSLAAAAPLLAYRKFKGETVAVAPGDGTSRAAAIAAGTALAGAVILIVLGFVTPSFADRYMISFAPGVMLGAAMIISWLGRRAPLVPLGTAAMLAMLAMIWASGNRISAYKAYNFDAESQMLMRAGIKHLVFTLDSPTAKVMDREQLNAAGTFFFRRAGKPISVDTVVLPPNEDPNARLLAAAERPGSGILWLYSLAAEHTAAAKFPPRFAEPNSGWTCQHRQYLRQNILACYRAP